MWKKLKQKGAETVEYAIVLACIAGLCVMFSDNLKATMDDIMGNVGSAITDSNKKGDNQEDPYGKWLQAFKQFADNNQELFNSVLKNTTNARKDDNFMNNDGLVDSGSTNSQSGLANKINETLANAGFADCSWSFGSYTDANNNKFYNISIYNPAKNGNTALADQKVGATITTDRYTINMETNQITKVQENATQKVVERDNLGQKYNVIRDSEYK